ncbi:DUF6879 family protein [Nonomuraea candida]|uniref:DUF6879 family protein n=1 Tax=Nonomuraea candida TaxID=359159 RepID=UPI0012F7D06E|nr:DUF6879 family protein [Nonomuraea candida]
MSADEYLDDFWPNFRRIDDVFWKLERTQSFRDPGEPGWTALLDAEWERSLKLIDDGQGLAVMSEGTAGNGHAGDSGGPGGREGAGGGGRQVVSVPRRRIRIVEQPVTPYLQWEMHVLAMRVRAAEQVRVLDAGEVAELEVGRRLPELVVLGTRVMYEVTYDESGRHSGARRIDDREVIVACQGELDKLFATGEEFRAYYEREIVPLPSPRVTA